MKGRNVRLAALAACVALLGIGLTATAVLGQTEESLTAARHSLIVGGSEIASFDSLEGIDTEVEASEYMEAGEKGPVFGRFIGKAKPPHVTLKRRQTSSRALWAWHAEARQGLTTAFKDSVLEMHDREGKTVAKYVLPNAWVSKLVVSATGKSGSQRLHETVTLTADDLIRETP